MSSWQFASKEGPLTWTSPEVPQGGQELYTVLSPSLLVGHIAKGDSLPVDFVRVPSIAQVTPRGPTGIHVHVGQDASPSLLAAGGQAGQQVLLVAATPDDAAAWIHVLHQAIGSNDAFAPAPAAEPTATAYAQERPALGHQAVAPAAPETLADVLARDMAGHHEALRASRTPSESFPDVVPVAADPLQSPEPTNPQHAAPPPAQGGAGLSLREVDRGMAGMVVTPRPVPAQVPPQGPAATTTTTWVADSGIRTTVVADPRDEPRFVAPVLPEGPAECPQDPEGHHRFRPIGEAQAPPHGTGAVTTSIAVHGEETVPGVAPLPQGPIVPPLKPLPRDQAGYQAGYQAGQQAGQAPTSAQSSLGTLGLPPHPAPHTPAMAGGRGGEFGTGGSVGAMGGMAAGMGGAMTGPGAGMGSMGMDQAQGTMGYGSVGSRSVAGPNQTLRRGMTVELPSSQAVNRNIAPNVSAVWREWTDPDGVKYYLHEATGALRRELPDGDVEVFGDDAGADLGPGDTTVDLNHDTVRNVQAYGTAPGTAPPPLGGSASLRSPALLRTERMGQAAVAAPDGTVLSPPRETTAGYRGKRLHRLSLKPGDELGTAVVEHQVQSLGADGAVWDPRTGRATNDTEGGPGSAALHRQWEHVRKVLRQGRYFKKHAATSGSTAYRFVFLTGDNTYVCSVPTSEVLMSMREQRGMHTVAETMQYYGPGARALPVNTVVRVVMGRQERLAARRPDLNPDATFVIVSTSHALILECGSPQEARFFCDAWNFYLFYSRPTNPKETRTPEMTAPVTHGLRCRVGF